MKDILKYIWFTSHKFGMYITPYLWMYCPDNILIFYCITILSWNLNKNRCLITQIEYYLFKETFLGNGKNFVVPFKHRMILYINFLIALFYQRKLNT